MRGTPRARLCRIAVSAALLTLAVVPAAASAGPLAKFSNCPKESPELQNEGAACVYSQSRYKTTKWEKPEPPSSLQAGNVVIPFVKPLVLQGGFIGITEGLVPLVAPEDGALRVVPVAEPVPGGLKSEIDTSLLHGAALAAFNEAVKNKETKVTATVEIAPTNAPIFLSSENLLGQGGTFLTLPLKMKFSNPFLGESCYSGSDAAPILVELTDGATNPPPPAEPITGQLGTLAEVPGRVIAIKEDSLVANSFEAPAVEGCGKEAAWQGEVDAAINAKAGLPSPPGHNSTRINGTQFLTGIPNLRERGL
jgi:hypothetical protein